MSRMRVISLVWLAVFWMAAWGDFTLGMFVFGLIVGALALVVFPLPQIPNKVVVRPVAALVLVLRFSWDLVAASAQVAWLAVRPRGISQGSVIAVPLRSEDELLQSITAQLVGLVPGTVVIDLGRNGTLDVHVLDLNTPAQASRVREDIWAQEDRVRRALEPGYTGPPRTQQAGVG